MPYSQLSDPHAVSQHLRQRQTPVVVIPVYNSLVHLKTCLGSVVRHSPPQTDVLIIDDCSDEADAVQEIVEQYAGSNVELSLLRKDRNEGYVRACNDAFDMTGRRDVLLVNSDCIVGPEWYERIVRAAASSTQIATVSTLTNHGSILSVPNRNQPSQHLPEELCIEQAARRISTISAQWIPEIPVAVGHCLLIRRIALDLVGSFDPIFGRGYGEEVDFSLRCVQMGLRNVCADDVFVFHLGHATFGAMARDAKLINEQIIELRYPYYKHLLHSTITDPSSDLAAAIDLARIALLGLRIGIDARKLSRQNNGTQMVIEQVLANLGSSASDSPIVAYHLPSFDPDSIKEHGVSRNIEWVATNESIPTEPEVDVIFRPCQVDTYDELLWLHSVGRRVVVYQLDTIAYSNPSYFESGAEWTNYQQLTRLCLSTADGIAAVSCFSGSEIERKGLVPDGARLKVIHHGALTREQPEELVSEIPIDLEDPERPFLLCVGVSYHHKNRLFCLGLHKRLVELGWDGDLIFVGAIPSHGGTRIEDLEDHLGDGFLHERVFDLESVQDPVKRWLYRNASLCLYPSVVEGFGLVPFESARLRTPVLASRLASLEELLGEEALIDDFDIERTSQTALHLLSCRNCRDRNVEALLLKAAAHSWDNFALEMNEFFREVMYRPKNRMAMEIVDRRHAWFAIASRNMERQQFLRLPISFLKSHPRIKRLVSPEGSRRQAANRRIANWVRRTFL